jgi:hypothetical protein
MDDKSKSCRVEVADRRRRAYSPTKAVDESSGSYAKFVLVRRWQLRHVVLQPWR